MPVEDYVLGSSSGYSDPDWIRSDGAFVNHPTFFLGELGVVYVGSASLITNELFGASITVEEDPPRTMAWDSIPDPRSVTLESPLLNYGATQHQAITLHRPYNAEWFSDATTSIATASSFDYSGYHTGPSGTPLHHITVGVTLNPTPGGPSSTLDHDAPWRRYGPWTAGAQPDPDVDPNITVGLFDNFVVFSFDPQQIGSSEGVLNAGVIRLIITCQTPEGTFPLTVFDNQPQEIRGHPFAIAYTMDDLFRIGDTAAVNADGAVLCVYDYPDGANPSRLMGVVNPGWVSRTTNTWSEYIEVGSGLPTMAPATLDHTILLDFQKQGGIS